MTKNVFAQVQGIASDIFSIPVSDIHSGSSPENTEGWDSIQHLNLVLAVEEKFNLQLSPEEIERMHDIGQIVKLVEGKLQATPS